MNAPCHDFEPLLLDRAAGLLDAAGDARLDGHLAGCAACRARAHDVERALALVALPPPAEAERALVRAGARGAVERIGVARRRGRIAGGMGLAIAASVALFLGVPGAFRGSRTPAPPQAVAVAWSLPDIDAAWAAAGAAFPAAADEAEPVVFFAELQEVDLDLE